MKLKEIKAQIKTNREKFKVLGGELDQLEAAIAESEKPKLNFKHGELLHWHKAAQSGTYAILDLSGQGDPYLIWPDSKVEGQYKRSYCGMGKIEACCNSVGNIQDVFDDLERNSKNLADIYVPNRTIPCNNFRIQIKPGSVLFGINGAVVLINKSDFSDFAEEVQQMDATIKRESK